MDIGCTTQAEIVSQNGPTAPVRHHSANAWKLAVNSHHVTRKWMRSAIAKALFEKRFIYLTRTSSAAASEDERGCGSNDFSHVKTG